MLTQLVGDWRVIMVRGVAALAFGVLTIIWPGITLWALVVLFGSYVLVDGVFTLLDVARNAPAARTHRALRVLDGVVGIGVGVVTFVWPAITALALLFLIAVWGLVAGAVRIWLAVEARDVIPDPWISAFGGVLSIAFAILLLITPGAGALVITWLIGWFAIVFGVVLFAEAWHLRSIQRESGEDRSRSIRGVTA
jgi:uncharacterized membrane protein HdeD (DUF308 family)